MEIAECLQHIHISPAPLHHRWLPFCRGVWSCSVHSPDSPRVQLGLKETCLACDSGRARGDEHTTLASGPHWPAFAEGHGAMVANTNHIHLVAYNPSNHAWGESKSLAQCCSQCIVFYPKKKRQAEKPLHWLTKEILIVTILHKGKIQNKCATSSPIRYLYLLR